METYKVYTRTIVLGQSLVVARDEHEARLIVHEEIKNDTFEPNMVVTECVFINRVSKK